tara:strand:- start:2393 stop:4828 length:2436 start_codon:yes stop_codon:yes gene_type:complete
MSPLKESFNSWRNYVNEDLLVESRYKDALAYAQNFNKMGKQFKVKDVVDQFTPEHEQRLKDAMKRGIEYAREEDPSGDNKYLMWIARYLRKDLARRLQKFSKNWSTDPVNYYDPEAKKNSAFDPDVITNSIASHLVDLVLATSTTIKDYHLLKQRNLFKKDINDYDPVNMAGDFKNDVIIAMRDYEGRQAKEKLKQQVKGEADDLLETDDYAVIRPNTEGASCYYGWGTRWCISARESRNYFNQYTGEGKSFYFVMFRHLPNSNRYKKVALVYGKDQGYETEPEQVFDATDEETGEVGLIEAITENFLYRVFQKSDIFEKTRNKIKGLEDQEDRDERLDGMKDMIARMIEDPTEDKIPNETVLKVANYLFPDTYSEVIDLEITPLSERFDELVQETYSDITGNAAYHAEQNPAGPKGEDYQDKMDEYNFAHVNVTYDEYDTNSWYWDGSAVIDIRDPRLSDLNIPEDVDMDEIETVVQTAIDNSSIYVDEIEIYDRDEEEIQLRFTPDYDEGTGLDGFERFLDRMSEYDDLLTGKTGFWEDLADAILDAGLTAGGLKELEAVLDEEKFTNIEYSVEGRKMEIVLELDPILGRPPNLPGLYFAQVIRALTGYSEHFGGAGEIGSMGKDKAEKIPVAIATATLDKIEDIIAKKFNMVWDQIDLPGFEREGDPKEIDALPLIDMGFYGKPRQISLLGYNNDTVSWDTGEEGKGGAGINVEYPYNFVLELTNEEYWESIGADDEESQALIRFLRWIDQDKVKDQIEAVLQGVLNDTVLQIIKNHPPQQAKKPAEADKEEDQQVAELFKRWNKFLG